MVPFLEFLDKSKTKNLWKEVFKILTNLKGIYDCKYFWRKVDTFILVFTALPSLLDLSQVYAMLCTIWFWTYQELFIVL